MIYLSWHGLSYALNLLLLSPLSDNLPHLFRYDFHQDTHQPWFSVLVFDWFSNVYIYLHFSFQVSHSSDFAVRGWRVWSILGQTQCGVNKHRESTGQEKQDLHLHP